MRSRRSERGSAWLVVILLTAVLSTFAVGLALVVGAERDLSAQSVRTARLEARLATARSLAALQTLESIPEAGRWSMQDSEGGGLASFDLEPVGAENQVPVAGFEWQGPVAVVLRRQVWNVRVESVRPAWLGELVSPSRRDVLSQVGPVPFSASAAPGGSLNPVADLDEEEGAEVPAAVFGVWQTTHRLDLTETREELILTDLRVGTAEVLSPGRGPLTDPVDLGPAGDHVARWLIGTRGGMEVVGMTADGHVEFRVVVDLEGCKRVGRISVFLARNSLAPRVGFLTEGDSPCSGRSLRWFALPAAGVFLVESDFEMRAIDEAGDPEVAGASRIPLVDLEVLAGPWTVGGTLFVAGETGAGEAELLGVILDERGERGLLGWSHGLALPVSEVVIVESQTGEPEEGDLDMDPAVREALTASAQQGLPRSCLGLRPRFAAAVHLVDDRLKRIFDLPVCAQTLLVTAPADS